MSAKLEIASDTTNEVRYYVREVIVSGSIVELVPDRHYSHRGKAYQPTRIGFRWDHGEPVKEVKVTGKLLRKNGSIGEAELQLTYSMEPHGWKTLAPEWLQELVRGESA